MMGIFHKYVILMSKCNFHIKYSSYLLFNLIGDLDENKVADGKDDDDDECEWEDDDDVDDDEEDQEEEKQAMVDDLAMDEDKMKTNAGKT